MLVSELQVGQNVTVAFWFRCGRYGDDKDYCVVTGDVTRTMPCYGKVEISVCQEVFGAYNHYTAWLDNKAELISINN